jgi:hypothetical protein
MWLGHESIQTTHQYLNADLDAKRRTLDQLRAPVVRRPKAGRRQTLELTNLGGVLREPPAQRTWEGYRAPASRRAGRAQAR